MSISTQIARALTNGKAVIIPTDTVLGILSIDEASIETIKQRNKNSCKKIVQFIHDIHQIDDSIPEDLLNLLNKHWPGPLTIIYKGKGYRIPDNMHILNALKQIKIPVYASSANITEHPTIKNIQEAKVTFKNCEIKIEFIDIKNLNKRKYKASTVYNYDTKQIIREGPISKESILKFLKA